jgi:hypothetical protein
MGDVGVGERIDDSVLAQHCFVATLGYHPRRTAQRPAFAAPLHLKDLV